MSGILDIFSSQNITRAQSVSGIVRTANETFRSNNVSGAGRVAVVGSLISQLGGTLTGFSSSNVRPPEKGFNISEFSSRINKYGGIGDTSKFLVNIVPPPCVDYNLNRLFQASGEPPNRTEDIKVFDRSSANELIFLCNKTSLPGLRINTVGIQNFGYGAIERRPVRAEFSTITLNFFVDVSGISYGFFTKWLSNIVNYNDESVGSKTSAGAFFNEIHYKTNYASKMSIYMFDTAGNGFIEVNLSDVFPIGMGEINLDWASTNDIAILPITFSYKSFKSNFTPPAEIGVGALRNLSLASVLMRAGTVVQGASSLLQRPRNITDAFNLVRNGSRLISSITR